MTLLKPLRFYKSVYRSSTSMKRKIILSSTGDYTFVRFIYDEKGDLLREDAMATPIKHNGETFRSTHQYFKHLVDTKEYFPYVEWYETTGIS